MEVQLKKTKITSNIVKQSLSGGYGLMLDNSNYDILGWCLHDKRRKVLMYNRLSNQVVTLPYIQNTLPPNISMEREGVQRDDGNGGWIFPYVYKIKVYFIDARYGMTLVEQINESDEQMNDKLTKIRQFILAVNKAGQIYL